MTASDARLERVVRRQRGRNRLQGVLLLAGMVLTLGLLAWLVFRGAGVVWVLVLGVVSLALRPRVRSEWVLRMYRARPLPARSAPDLHRLIDTLAARAQLPRPPALYYVPSPMLNAFAVGDRDDAAIAVTDGLLRRLPWRELAGVLAHEVSHIRSGDLRMMTLADMVGRLTQAVAYAGLVLIVFGLPALMAGTLLPLLAGAVLLSVPNVTTLLQLALSRAREYDADLAAAELTNDPLGLASALRTLHVHEGRVWERIMVPHRRTPDTLLLRTHPPTDERIRRLRELAPPDRWPQVTQEPDGPGPPAGLRPVAGPVRLRMPGIWW